VKLLYLSLLSLCLARVVDAEVIWSEDFNAGFLDGKGAIGPGNQVDVSGITAWTVSVVNAGMLDSFDWFRVVSQQMDARDTGGESIWLTQTIDISAYTNVGITIDASEPGTMEISDYIRFYYRLNGGAETLFSQNGNLSDDFTSAQAAQSGLYGSNLHVIVKVNNSADDERHRFDTVLVTGALISVSSASGTTHYVSLTGGHVSPYTNWATAATTLQAAVDVAAGGSLVLVSNGVYAADTRVTPGAGLLNRLVLTNGITVRSVNGPSVTAIQGQGPLGPGAVRCVFLTNGAALAGFTLTNGFTWAAGGSTLDRSGGGAWAVDGVLSNCVITGNRAQSAGGGAYGGTLSHCVVSGNEAPSGGGTASSTLRNSRVQGNSASAGGGAYLGSLENCVLANNVARYPAGGLGGGAFFSTLNNCTVFGNQADDTGGGVYRGTQNNCIVYFNTAARGANHFDGNFESSCTTPLPDGPGNIDDNPRLLSSVFIALDSPCAAAGSAAYSTGVDIDGEPWQDPPSMGCDQLNPGALTGALQVALVAQVSTAATYASVRFTPVLSGPATSNVFTFGDGTAVTNRPFADHAWTAGGFYSVICNAYNFSHPGGVAATAKIQIVSAETTARYVNPGSPAPAYPYASWASAAITIQDAVDAQTTFGGWVIVTDGVYSAGSRLGPTSGVPNRLVITNHVVVRSVNGPAATIIRGQGPLGAGAVRCAYLSAGRLDGFTLTNGFTFTSGDVFVDRSGGGVYARGDGRLTNCVITGNAAFSYAGGVAYGALDNCTIVGNTASNVSGGASYRSVLRNCSVRGNASYSSGGGAYGGSLDHCDIVENESRFLSGGGGAAVADLVDCTLQGNFSLQYGGGAANCTLVDCLVVSNACLGYGGGGVDGSTLMRCTLSGNVGGNWGGGAYESTLSDCSIVGNEAYNGGGVYDSILHRCVVSGNVAYVDGGGAAGGTLYGCALTGNSATESGGGSYMSTQYHCTVTGNAAENGGGLAGGAIRNCIVYFNQASSNANHNDAALVNSCSFPLPPGAGNIDEEPDLLSPTRIAVNSPCIGAGNPVFATGTDLDGEAWADPPTMGCDEPVPLHLTGTLHVALVPEAFASVVGYPLRLHAHVTGRAASNVLSFGDGVVATNLFLTNHAWSSPGVYEVVLRAFNLDNPAGVSTAITIQVVFPEASTVYVATNSPSPTYPYTNWTTAAHTIQDGVDAQQVQGGLVLATDGVYRSGTRITPGWNHHNRLVITNTIVVSSVNGPEATVIDGQSTVRCVFMTNSARLVGFTLTSGATRPVVSGFPEDADRRGGGVWIAGGSLSNCILIANSAGDYGGGAYGGVLDNCVLAENVATDGGGGAYRSRLRDCQLMSNVVDGIFSTGGGALDCVLENCALIGNQNDGHGGGAAGSALERCTLERNTAGSTGGGAYDSTLNTCTLSGNSASVGGGAAASVLNNCAMIGNSAYFLSQGGGAFECTLNNCTVLRNSAGLGGGVADSIVRNSIVYYNDATINGDNYVNGSLYHSCTTPPPPPGENISASPQLMSVSNFHLTGGSPCIDAGQNASAVGDQDLDGQARILQGTVDMGADEFATSTATGMLTVAVRADFTSAVVQAALPFEAEIHGQALSYGWHWGDGSSNGADLIVEHAYADVGTYGVVLKAWNLQQEVAATVTVSIAAYFTNYVSLAGSHTWPFISWATAATSIQEAIDAAYAGGTVLVAPGTYNQGAYERDGMRSRIGVYKPMTVKADHADPAQTVIEGAGPPGSNAVRCAYLGQGARLTGFTLTNGATRTLGGGSYAEIAGGGAWCEKDVVLSNCVLRGNQAYLLGGGVARGTLLGCTLENNTAKFGGGAYNSTLSECSLVGNSVSQTVGGLSAAPQGAGAYFGWLYDCTLSGNRAEDLGYGGGASMAYLARCLIVSNTADSYGGGVSEVVGDACSILGNAAFFGGGAYGSDYEDSFLTNCLIAGNTAVLYGGGARGGKLYNCVLSGNVASYAGGGAYDADLECCTVVGNSASNGGGTASSGEIRSSIIMFNFATGADSNFSGTGVSYEHSCSSPLPAGPGSISADPLFENASGGNFRLKASSPCIDRGVNQPWMLEAADPDGNSRIINGTVDMGAYELVFEANLKGLLQGAYDTNLHRMAAQIGLPSNAPYAADARLAAATPSNAIDWVAVELRRETNSSPTFTRSVWLGDDGVLMADTGAPPILLEVGTGTYYVVLHHRNHLSAMTAAPIAFTNRAFSYDFTTSAEQSYGGSNAVVEVESNVWALIAADADGDGAVLAVDEEIFESQSE